MLRTSRFFSSEMLGGTAETRESRRQKTFRITACRRAQREVSTVRISELVPSELLTAADSRLLLLDLLIRVSDYRSMSGE